MAFRFSLAAVLKLRTLLEQRERSALERTVAAERTQQQRLHTADAISAQHMEDVHGALASGISASELHWSALRMQLVQCARAEGEKVLHDLRSTRADQTNRYIEAHKKVETLEHVKSEMLAEYEQQVSRREQSLIDWLHLARLVRERLNGAAQEDISR